MLGPQGERHTSSNPYGILTLVLGIWSPASPAIAFMRDIGAALSPDKPPDPDHMREICTWHASRLLP